MVCSIDITITYGNNIYKFSNFKRGLYRGLVFTLTRASRSSTRFRVRVNVDRIMCGMAVCWWIGKADVCRCNSP